ncbi:uncharacterized protein LOC111643102 [Copidosoma floridanum]|uniref:uncharacterized protein LOC111643102 n=1 Tax=Copidosoma floridanum TaxID=29053 RepID=UPI000C6F499E|nr:uncharacterized protein LOC111643102 [Copidosoma floridanum]
MIDMTLSMFNRRKFVGVWNTLQNVDERFPVACSLGLRKTKFVMWTMITLSTSVWLCVSQAGIQAFAEPYLRNVSYLIAYVGSYMSVLKFCGMVYLFNRRFNYLEDVICEQVRLVQEEKLSKDKLRGLITVAEGQDLVISLFEWRKQVYQHTTQKTFYLTLYHLKQKIMFTGAGCFHVHLPLLTKITHYITTFVVILVQLVRDLEK